MSENTISTIPAAQQELMQSLSDHTILHSDDCAVKTDISGNFFMDVMYRGFKVIIPLVEYTDTDFQMLNAKQKNAGFNISLEDSIRHYLKGREKGGVDFIVTSMPQDSSERCYASRVLAMEELRRRFWFGEDLEEGQSAVEEETVYKANIIATSKTGVRVELFGAETFIPNSDLSPDEFFKDASKYFHVGDSLDVEVTRISLDSRQNYTVDYDASMLYVYDNLKDLEPTDLVRGEVYHGPLSYYFQAKGKDTLTVFVKLGKDLNVRCEGYPAKKSFLLPPLGTVVPVRVSYISKVGNTVGVLLVRRKKKNQLDQPTV